jgi:hypothetical protein
VMVGVLDVNIPRDLVRCASCDGWT